MVYKQGHGVLCIGLKSPIVTTINVHMYICKGVHRVLCNVIAFAALFLKSVFMCHRSIQFTLIEKGSLQFTAYQIMRIRLKSQGKYKTTISQKLLPLC